MLKKILSLIGLTSVAVATTLPASSPDVEVLADNKPQFVFTKNYTREEAPEFRVEYKSRISPQVRIEVNVKYSNIWKKITYSGYLYQNNGKMVIFSPEDIADKIIDRDLVPLVIAACDQIMKEYLEYYKNNNHRFVDERGDVWVKEVK